MSRNERDSSVAHEDALYASLPERHVSDTWWDLTRRRVGVMGGRLRRRARELGFSGAHGLGGGVERRRDRARTAPRPCRRRRYQYGRSGELYGGVFRSQRVWHNLDVLTEFVAGIEVIAFVMRK